MLQFNFIKGREVLFTKGYTQLQVDRLNMYFQYATETKVIPQQLAYILGTVYHETGVKDPMRGGMIRFIPVEETGKGKDRRYGKKQKYDGTTYKFPDKIYYGRGDAQLTWYEVYEKAERVCKIPGLLKNPELALESRNAMIIAVEGMKAGIFTGRKLNQYITEKKQDYRGARWIINLQDKADLIATYAKEFLACIEVIEPIA